MIPLGVLSSGALATGLEHALTLTAPRSVAAIATVAFSGTHALPEGSVYALVAVRGAVGPEIDIAGAEVGGQALTPLWAGKGGSNSFTLFEGASVGSGTVNVQLEGALSVFGAGVTFWTGPPGLTVTDSALATGTGLATVTTSAHAVAGAWALVSGATIHGVPVDARQDMEPGRSWAAGHTDAPGEVRVSSSGPPPHSSTAALALERP